MSAVPLYHIGAEIMKRHILIAGLIWLSATAAASAQTTKPSDEAKLIAELYGKRIAEVQASVEPADDIALARDLLLTAADSANPTTLRYLITMEALKLSAPLGSEEAAKLATEALTMADQLKPLPPIEKCRFEVQIAKQRHTFALKNGVSAKDCVPLAEAAIEAEIALAQALMRAQETKQARVVLAAASYKAGKYKLPDQQADVKALMKALRALDARLGQIRIFEARLEQALKENNHEIAKTLRQNLALIYLLDDGDIPKAASYLSGTDHKYESAVTVAAAFLKDPQKIPSPDSCNDAIKSLINAAKSAKCEDAKVRIAMTATNLCRALQAGKLTGLAAVETRLLLAESEKLAGDSPADRFIRLLKANYKDLACEIEVLKPEEKVVRVTYDFSRQKQLNDWRILRGSWSTLRNKEALIAEPEKGKWAGITNRLRFRADKPFRFTFRASGSKCLVGKIGFNKGNAPAGWVHWLNLQLGARNNSCSRFYDGGARGWLDDRIRIDRNTTYRIKMEWDGQKTLTCTTNDKVLFKNDVRYRKENLQYTSLFVHLGTIDQPAGFDDVTLEGVILEDPNQRLKASGKP